MRVYVNADNIARLRRRKNGVNSAARPHVEYLIVLAHFAEYGTAQEIRHWCWCKNVCGHYKLFPEVREGYIATLAHFVVCGVVPSTERLGVPIRHHWPVERRFVAHP